MTWAHLQRYQERPTVKSKLELDLSCCWEVTARLAETFESHGYCRNLTPFYCSNLTKKTRSEHGKRSNGLKRGAVWAKGQPRHPLHSDGEISLSRAALAAGNSTSALPPRVSAQKSGRTTKARTHLSWTKWHRPISIFCKCHKLWLFNSEAAKNSEFFLKILNFFVICPYLLFPSKLTKCLVLVEEFFFN